MAQKIPEAHVVAETWFRYLCTLKAPHNAPLRGLNHPLRSFLIACLDVAEARHRAIQADARHAHAVERRIA
jgi:hypothetical protein